MLQTIITSERKLRTRALSIEPIEIPMTTCPKCGSPMNSDKVLASYIPVSPVILDQFIGERLETYYCPNCGYVELYRKKS